jgi:hypothetical protein
VPKFQPRFESLASCLDGDLLRVSYKSETRWAIIGALTGSRSVRLLAILSGEGSPHLINVIHDGSLRGEFEMHQVLVYAKKGEYTITPDYFGECDIDEGPNFEIDGSLILTVSGKFLRIPLSTGGSGFLSLDNYDCRGGPPQHPRAAFKKWTLTCELFEGLDAPVVLRGPPLEPRPKVRWDASERQA